MGQMRYKVYFTPLTDIAASTYGDEIDVSDRIEIGGIGNISKSIDSSDYNIGVFFYSDITLNGFNYNGYFNDETDTRSIFEVTRDRCKVRVVFSDIDITRNSSNVITDAVESTTITFKGLINEEATQLDAVTDKITFKVLSYDSVLRTTNIPAGTITNGSLASTAMFNILNLPRITSVLVLDILNINPDYDYTIDDGSALDNKSVKEALDQLLIAANSIMFIDDSDNIIIRDRAEDGTIPIVNLYGKSDLQGRENIIDITAYNLGRHRTFTSVMVNDTEETDSASVMSFGFRQKKVEFEFITNNTTESAIAQRLVDEFKSPRIELNVKVATSLAKSVRPLHRISINYPLRIEPVDGFMFLPYVGVAVIGDTQTPLPGVFGAISIPANYGFKVIEITENPKDFTSILKLRQVNDLVFNTPNNCIVGFAVIEESAICVGGTACDAFEVANIGAAQIGCTLIA